MSLRPAIGTMLVAVPAGLGLLLVIVGLVTWSVGILGAGLGLVVVPIVVAVVEYRGRLAAARHGHHREFAIGVGPGFSVVTTTNPRVRDELLAQGGKHLERRGA